MPAIRKRSFRPRLETLESRLALAAPTAVADTYAMDRGERLIAAADSRADIVEDFSGTTFTSDLEGARFTVENGWIRRTEAANHNDREYLRTVRGDFLDIDFRYELTFTVGNTGQTSIVFIGIGRGQGEQGRAHQEPLDSVNFRIHAPDTGDGFVSVANNPSSALKELGNLRQPGTHRARIEKIGNRVVFAIDAHYTGQFDADLSYTVEDLASVAPFLTDTTTHLFFGTALPDVLFDDFHVQQLPRPGVLSNDSAEDGQPLSAVLVEAPLHGQLALQPDGSFLYTPEPDFQGRDSFQYVARAGNEDSPPAVVQIDVAALRQTSVARDDRYELQEDGILSVDAVVQDFRRIALPKETREIVYSRARGLFYAAVPSPGPAEAGAVLEIDPVTGSLERRIVVGAGPNQLAVSDDGAYLYVGLDDVPALTRIELDSGSVASPVPLGDVVAEDIEVFPGKPGTIGVTLAHRSGSPRIAGAAIFDDLIRRQFPPNNPLPNVENNFAFDDTGSRAVGILAELSNRSVWIVQVTEEGWERLLNREFFIPGNPEGEIKWAAERIFFDSGQVFEPSELDFLGWLPYGSTTADVELGRFFTAQQNRIVVSRLDTLAPLFDFRLMQLPEEPLRGITRFGEDGLAAVTGNHELVTFRSDLVSGVPGPRGLLTNDSLSVGLPPQLRIAEPPQHGSVALNQDGSFTYQPDADFAGQDQFVYTINDSFAESSPATVTVQVHPVSDPPQAANDQYTVGQTRTLVTRSAAGVLANDREPEGEPMSAVLLTGPRNGTLTLDPDGSFVYTPNVGFIGNDSFTYKATDGQLESEAATVSIAVQRKDIFVALRAVRELTPDDLAQNLPNSITTVDVGDDYFVEMWLQSVADPAAGISGGQINLRYEPTLTNAEGATHSSLFNQITTGQLLEDQGLLNDFGGGTISLSAGTAPGWARLGFLRVQATSAGEAVYTPSRGRLRFSLLGQGNVDPGLVDFSETLIVDHFAGADLGLTVSLQPTQLDESGEVEELPRSLPWIDEWASFWVEVWASSKDGASAINQAQLDLNYDTRYLTALELQPGMALGGDFTGTIDDATGVVSDLGGTFTRGDVGDDGHVLVARVRFASVGGDSVPVDQAGHFLGPYRPGFAVSDARVTLSGEATATPTELPPAPETELWSVPYDIDDNNLIDFGDVSFFAAAFGKAVGQVEPPYVWWADFDRTGEVDFGDFSFLAANFALDRAAQGVQLPPGYPPGGGQVAASADHAPVDDAAAVTAGPVVRAHAAHAGSDDDKLHVALVAVSEATPADTVERLPEGLSHVERGASFVLEVWLQDGIEPRVGITGGQIDIAYSAAPVTLSHGQHGQVFATLTSGTIDAAAGRVDDFGGGTILSGQGQAPAWTKFGSFRAEVRSSGPIGFEALRGKLQFSRFGLGNVPWEQVAFSGLVLNRLPGDVDGNGQVGFSDFVILANNFGRGDATLDEGDLDGDGNVQFSDFVVLANSFGQPIQVPGDVDGNGLVDFSDFLILANHFGRTDAARAEGDLDNNGDVDFSDFLILANNFGK